MNEYIAIVNEYGRGQRSVHLTDIEIVRCRDCEFSVYDGKYCANDCIDIIDWQYVEPNGFCAWGEKRDA